MSYSNKLFASARVEASPGSIASTGVLSPGVIAIKDCQVAVAAFLVTTAVVSSGPVVITVKKRPTSNSSSGEVSMGTITIPAGTAAGTLVYRKLDEDLASRSLEPGQVCVYEVTTAAAGGGAAGAGIPLPEVWENPQDFKVKSNALEVFA